MRSSSAVLQPCNLLPTYCLSDSIQAIYLDRNLHNIDSLKEASIISVISVRQFATPLLFEWPLKASGNLTDYGYHAMSAYVDHDPTYPNQLSDFNCGDLTYDTNSGYNHQGSDFFIWPFPWNKMDSDLVQIIAAAPGIIIDKQDGNFDKSCSMNNNPWNYVSIIHGDGSYAWYGHMKNGSVTQKNIGDSIALGEYLGIVGSSGNSSGPHLHFQVFDQSSNLIDPFAGTCNTLNTYSWWANQKPEIDPAINRIRTNSSPPIFLPCPQPTIQNEKNYFWQTDTIYLMTYYRHLSAGDSVIITIYQPDNSVWGSWPWVCNNSFFAAAYMYYWMVPGSSAPSGQWRFTADYKGFTYEHNFYVGISQQTPQRKNSDFKILISPNPAKIDLKIDILSKYYCQTLIRINNLQGQSVYSDCHDLRTGNNTVILDVSDFSSGMYFISLQNTYLSEMFKLIIR